MRMLLVSDTHGRNIDLISAYAEEMKADLCIHAGDFGFYDGGSAGAMSKKERTLLIRHSTMETEEKEKLLVLDPDEQISGILHYRLLGDFPDYLSREKNFAVPVYAVWGNHDDSAVAAKMMNSPVPRLQILHENTFFSLDDAVLLGLGGNCLPEKAFTRNCRGIPGTQCRPDSILAQYTRLLRTAAQVPPGRKRILVIHVSPLVEPFLELTAWLVGADLTVSGHMGRKNGETGITDDSRFPVLMETFQRLLELYPEASGELQSFQPRRSGQVIRHINLPDAEDGYGILEFSEGTFRFEIRGIDFRTGPV